MGFFAGSPKQSILVYKKKNHYNEWEFATDPIADQMMMQGRQYGSHRHPGRQHAWQLRPRQQLRRSAGATTGGSGFGHPAGPRPEFPANHTYAARRNNRALLPLSASMNSLRSD